jgi:type IV secretory pathway VirB2 component (pilin)
VAQRAGLCQCLRLEMAIPGEMRVLVSRVLRGGLTLALAAMASAALAGVPADPAGSGVIIGAVNWLQGTLLGTVATVAAVIAVAAVGFMMLTGRINWRHGAVVILGCFILFGAASIVAGIRAAAAGG